MPATMTEKNGQKTTVPVRRENVSPSLEPFPAMWGGGPFSMMRRMMEDMERMFEDWGIARRSFDFPLMSRMTTPAMWNPTIEIFEKGDKMIVQADLPGLKKDDVTIEIVDGHLAIRGERKSEHEEKREGYFRTERSYGLFNRVIPLPEGIADEAVKAHFKDGVLSIEMPIPEKTKKEKEKEKGRKVDIA